MQLVFATHNLYKLNEVQTMLPTGIDLLSLDDNGCHEEIPETGKTLEENADRCATSIWQDVQPWICSSCLKASFRNNAYQREKD